MLAGSGTSNGIAGHERHSAADGFGAKPAPDAVQSLVKADHFGGVFEQVELLNAAHQVAEPHTDEPDEHAPLVKPVEQFECNFCEYVVERGVRNGFLQRVGVEVGITDFHGDTAGELFLFAHLVGDFFDHRAEDFAHAHHIDGVQIGRAHV